MRRVLMVSYYFPPLGGIASIRAASFAAELPAFGWEAVVLAPRRASGPRDAGLALDERRVVRSASIELSRAGTSVLRAIGRDGAARARAVPRLARAVAHRFLYYPDPQIGWYPGAVRAGLRTIRSRSFDAIFSTSVPITCHLIARTLHRRSDLPWIVEYRDPWSDLLPAGDPSRRRARGLETAIAAEASAIVMPSPSWAARYGARWGRPVAVIANGAPAGIAASSPCGDPVLGYLGSFLPGRQELSTVWAALRRLADSGVAIPRVRFIGDPPASLRRELEAHGLSDRVEITGLVEHDDAIRVVRSSTMLLAAGPLADDPINRGLIPAKLFEYLASGLPILYVGALRGDAAELLGEQPGCWLVAPGDVDGAIEALRLPPGTVYDRDLARIGRRDRARRLAELLDEVTRR